MAESLSTADQALLQRIIRHDSAALKQLYVAALPRLTVAVQDNALTRRYLQDALLKIRDDGQRHRFELNGAPNLRDYAVHLVRERLEKEAKDREIEQKIYTSLMEAHADGWAFYYMQVHFFPAISYFVQKNGGTDEEAKDVIMDGIEALIRNIRDGSYQPRSNAKLKTYFFQICRNKWYDVLEKRKRTRPASLFADLELDQFEAEYYYEYDYELLNDRQRKVAEVFEQASESCRQVLGYYYYDELSHDEIADRMGYSGADSSKTQKNKCLRKLKKVLTDWLTREEEAINTA